LRHLHFYPDQTKIISFHPRVVFTGTLEGGPNWSNGIHSHNFCEIMYITDGSGVCVIEGVEYPVRAGDIIVYNTGVFHEERSAGERLSILFFAADIQIPGMAAGCVVPEDAPPIIQAGSYDETLKTFISVMVSELEQKQAHYKAISTHIAGLFCHYILRLYGVKLENQGHSEICQRAKQYLDNHYREDINLSRIADGVHLSKYHFIHIFKEHTGMTPMKYLLFVRMSAAKELLAREGLPIGEVAAAVGYENALAFSRVFKNSEAISPTEYRKKVLDLRNNQK
jgi:AraC-like DNA-binding protein